MRAGPVPDPRLDSKPIAELRSGTALLPRAFALLRRHRELWSLALIPIALTLLAVSGATALFLAHAGEVFTWLGAALPQLEAQTWYAWLWVGPALALLFVVRLLLFALVGLLAVIASSLLATIAASPVLDALSLRVERLCAGRAAGEDERGSLGSLLSDALASILNEARRVGFFALLWLGILALGWLLPGGAAVTPLALGAVTVFFLPLEYAGYALDRRRIPFAERRAWLRRHRYRMLGFGAAAFALGLVPLLNFALLPLLVVAGTLLVVECPPEPLPPPAWLERPAPPRPPVAAKDAGSGKG